MNWSGCQSTGAERRKYFTVILTQYISWLPVAEEVGGMMAYGYRLAATRLAHLEADSAGPHWRA